MHRKLQSRFSPQHTVHLFPGQSIDLHLTYGVSLKGSMMMVYVSPLDGLKQTKKQHSFETTRVINYVLVEIVQLMSFMQSSSQTHFAAMESLRVFKLLNMAFWFGGTLSAKATQSRAFTAARRPAISLLLSKQFMQTWLSRMTMTFHKFSKLDQLHAKLIVGPKGVVRLSIF